MNAVKVGVFAINDFDLLFNYYCLVFRFREIRSSVIRRNFETSRRHYSCVQITVHHLPFLPSATIVWARNLTIFNTLVTY